MSLKSFITESIGILRSNSGPECAMAVDQIEQSVTKEFARLERRAKDWAIGRIKKYTRSNKQEHSDIECFVCRKTLRIPFQTFSADCEIAEKEKALLVHAHDCDAAHIVGLERESER